jgi:hypothetical protein
MKFFDFNLRELDIAREFFQGEPYKNKMLEDYEYLVVGIASHGNEKDEILDNSSKPYSLRNLYNAAIGNEKLEKMPKIFILNICRGTNELNSE